MIEPNSRRIKWSYATKSVANRPNSFGQAANKLSLNGGPPKANDVIVAEVLEIGRHTSLENDGGRKSRLFRGDLVGVAFGHRYATRQWRGRIPDALNTCHLLSVGGVCGEVVDMNPDMDAPTILQPVGYLLNGGLERANLFKHRLHDAPFPQDRPRIVLVVGSAMDSGKTTAAYSTVHGLARSGHRVCGAKLTGTASAKDLLRMRDAGAERTLDFTDVGHASTAECSREQLRAIATTIITELSSHTPDYLVLEIADGVVQRETEMLLRELNGLSCIDYTIYTCNDTLGVREGVRILRDIGLNVVAISGWVACSPLAAQEAQAVSDLPVLQPDDLMEPSIAALLNGSDELAVTPAPRCSGMYPAAVDLPAAHA